MISVVLKLTRDSLSGLYSIKHVNGPKTETVFTGSEAECQAFQKGSDFGIQIGVNAAKLSAASKTKQ